MYTKKTLMGAICGDIIGSVYEFRKVDSMEFPMFIDGTKFTDDTVMTVAIADWISDIRNPLMVAKKLYFYGHKYPNRGYGKRFDLWLDCKLDAYNSYGNGSAMRVSACGLYTKSLEEALHAAKVSALPTHGHPEGIKGAQAVAACIYLSKEGKSKEYIKDYIQSTFNYDLSRTLSEIRKTYSFNEICQTTVPEAITCWLESNSYEETVRNAIFLNGDSDTLAAIAGSIACVQYDIPEDILTKCRTYLDKFLLERIDRFDDLSRA